MNSRMAPAHGLAGAAVKLLAGRRGAGISFERLYPSAGRLGGHDRQALMATLRGIDKEASGWDAAVYWASRANFLNEIDVLVLAHIEGEIVGFMSQQWLRAGRHAVVYIDATAVKPDHQHRAVGTLLIVEMGLTAFFGHVPRPFVIALRTENPVVFAVLHDGFGAYLHPRLDGEPLPSKVLSAAAAVAAFLGQDERLDMEQLVIKGAHHNREGVLRPALPQARSELVNRHFARHVDVQSGDAAMIVIPGSLGFPSLAVKHFQRLRRRARARGARLAQSETRGT